MADVERGSNAGPQVNAFFAVLVDTGCRKSEALGLTWEDVDFDAGTLTIARQREPRKTTPEWGPTNGTARTVNLGAETIVRFRAHRKQQRELRMANRTTYKDFGLVFAKKRADLNTPTAALGQPCPALVGRSFRQVVKTAVWPIKDGTRHTCATLLLSGVSMEVVADRLAQAGVTTTIETYTAGASRHVGVCGGEAGRSAARLTPRLRVILAVPFPPFSPFSPCDQPVLPAHPRFPPSR